MSETLQSNQAVALANEFTPPQLLHQAIIKKSDIAVIERMAALAERWQERIDREFQRKAFITAMVAAKAEMPTIVKNRHVFFVSKKPGASDTDYWHEDLAAVVETAQPVLAKHGLHFRWRLAQPGEGKVTVTCILEHQDGHAVENEITAGVDLSGNKNHIQAIKSVATYLERLTALASVGMAARGQDDDGRAGGVSQGPTGPFITGEQRDEILRLVDLKGRNLDKFLEWCEVGEIEHIPLASYDDIIGVLNRLPDVEA